MAPPKEASPLKTVEKAVRILQQFSHDRPELSIGDLSRELKIHKSIVSRLVSTLCQYSLLQQNPETRRVRIGVGAFRLGSIFASRQEIVSRAAPFLGVLVNNIGQSAHAMVLDGTRGLVVASVESPSALRVIMRAGEHRYLHATAGGKQFLAFSPGSLFDAIVAEPGLISITPSTIVDRDLLAAELEAIRKTRVSWNNGESHNGAGAVAAPVLDEGGNIIMAITVVYPIQVLSQEEKEEVARQTLLVSEQLSKQFRIESKTAPQRRQQQKR